MPSMLLTIKSAGYLHTDKRWIEIKALTSGEGILIVGHEGPHRTEPRTIPFDQLWEHAYNGRSSPIYGAPR